MDAPAQIFAGLYSPRGNAAAALRGGGDAVGKGFEKEFSDEIDGGSPGDANQGVTER